MGGNLWEKQLLYYLCLFLFGNKNNVNANALNENGELNLISSETIYYENGDYSIITTYANKSQMQTRSNVYQTTGEKIVKNYNKSNELLWTYTLTGYFTVDEGISATCYNATYAHAIYDSAWHFSDGSTSCEENIAHGYGTFKFLSVTVQTYVINISLTCDYYGNIS